MSMLLGKEGDALMKVDWSSRTLDIRKFLHAKLRENGFDCGARAIKRSIWIREKERERLPEVARDIEGAVKRNVDEPQGRLEKAWREQIFCNLDPSVTLIFVLVVVNATRPTARNYFLADTIRANKNAGINILNPFRLPGFMLVSEAALLSFLLGQRVR
jgi:hypothetical protein